MFELTYGDVFVGNFTEQEIYRRIAETKVAVYTFNGGRDIVIMHLDKVYVASLKAEVKA